LTLGGAFVRTIRHFWPDMNRWLDGVADTRVQRFVTYHKAFLIWLGLGIHLFRLGARRQLDFEMGGDQEQEAIFLANLNRLAATHQHTLPVNGTLEHYVSDHMGWEPLEQVRNQMLRRLMRMKALDMTRLLDYRLVLLDATGHLSFDHKHCDHCLTQTHGGKTSYYHSVLEAKLVGPQAMVLSMASEFMDNSVMPPPTQGQSKQDYKQDCELAAFQRLAPKLKQAFPQTALCLCGDSLYGCGPAISICREHGWGFVFTLKQGRAPALWQEFCTLLDLCPHNGQRVQLPDGGYEVYRWVNGLDYTDSHGQAHRLNAIDYVATSKDATAVSHWAWITGFTVTPKNVVAIANQAGRARWKIENEGINIQKNDGYDLEHAYSHHEVGLRVFYLLLQLAHLMMQVFERGSLLKRLAQQAGKRNIKAFFGKSLNVARRLLEAFRNVCIETEAFDPNGARPMQIRFDSS